MVGVTRGDNWGCHPYFSKKLTTFLLITVNHCHFYWFYSGVTPPEGVTPRLFYLSDLMCPQFFVNLPTNLFSVRVSPGAVRGDATTYKKNS